MNLKSAVVCTALALAVTAAACTKSSPTRPTDAASAGTSTSSVTDATTGVTITTPTLASPADGFRFKYADQPITLTINNAASTGGTITYSFQVATDAGFTNIAFSKDGVAAGASTTTQKVDTLAGNKDYYWRSRAVVGSASGPWSKGRTFNVGPQVVIQAPVQVSPANGGNSSGQTPSFTVNNASRTGPAGSISYRFELSDSTSFANLLGVSTVGEQAGQTTAQISARLTAQATYYWRVRADDTTTGVSSPFSTVWSFKYVPFDMRQAIMVDNPADVGYWAETAKITSVNFTGDAFLVDFDKRDSPDRWPDVPFGSGDLQYTLGMCGNINGQWYCSAAIQFWYGRELSASTPPSYVARNWFYDSRWGPLNGYQPQNGETVGLFVAAGNLRDASYNLASCPRVCERSNVAFVQWHNDDQALFTFAVPGGRTLSIGRKR
jgi:hypothetical protein